MALKNNAWCTLTLVLHFAGQGLASGVFFDGLGPLSPAASASMFPIVTPSPSRRRQSLLVQLLPVHPFTELNTINHRSDAGVPVFHLLFQGSKAISHNVPVPPQLVLPAAPVVSSPRLAHRIVHAAHDPVTASATSSAPVTLHDSRNASLTPPLALPPLPRLHQMRAQMPHALAHFGFTEATFTHPNNHVLVPNPRPKFVQHVS